MPSCGNESGMCEADQEASVAGADGRVGGRACPSTCYMRHIHALSMMGRHGQVVCSRRRGDQL